LRKRHAPELPYLHFARPCILKFGFKILKSWRKILPDDSIRHNEALAENGSEFRILYCSDNRSLLRVDNIRHELSTILLRWRISRTSLEPIVDFKILPFEVGQHRRGSDISGGRIRNLFIFLQPFEEFDDVISINREELFFRSQN